MNFKSLLLSILILNSLMLYSQKSQVQQPAFITGNSHDTIAKNRLGLIIGGLQTFPEYLHGTTNFSVSMIWIFDHYKKLSTETGITLYQKGFEVTDPHSNWYLYNSSFKDTYLQVPLHVTYKPFAKSGFSIVYGIAGSCVINKRYTEPFYGNNLIYEVDAHGGFQFEQPLDAEISFIARGMFEYVLYRTSKPVSHAIIGSAGLLFNL